MLSIGKSNQGALALQLAEHIGWALVTLDGQLGVQWWLVCPNMTHYEWTHICLFSTPPHTHTPSQTHTHTHTHEYAHMYPKLSPFLVPFLLVVSPSPQDPELET